MRNSYDITPVPKPRETSSDRWRGQPGRPPMRPCVARYRAFADQVRALGIQLPESGSSVLFVIPMPKSWSKKRQNEMNLKPHQQIPDVKNLLGALEDAVYYKSKPGDECIWQYRGLEKRWGYEGKIIIQIEERR